MHILHSHLLLSTRVRLSVKIRDEYRHCKELPPALVAQQGPIGPARPRETRKMITAGRKDASVFIYEHLMTLLQLPRTAVRLE